MQYDQQIEMLQEENESTKIQQEVRNLREGDDDLKEEAVLRTDAAATKILSMTEPPVASYSSTTQSHPFHFVPLRMGGNGRTHVVSDESRELIEKEVTLSDLQKMTELFYEKAFKDPVLDKFLRNHDDPHGARFAKWIHQKLSGSIVWDQDRKTRDLRPVRLAGGHQHVVHDRSSAHAAAWYSPKRPKEEVGRHFELDEARVWMRLHFWALRESGMLEKSPSFSDYYVRFIAHFVRVYESSAPAFARDSFRWSADPANITHYQNTGRMDDVMNLTWEEAEAQIPDSESNDFVWPYSQTAPEEQRQESQSQ